MFLVFEPVFTLQHIDDTSHSLRCSARLLNRTLICISCHGFPQELRDRQVVGTRGMSVSTGTIQSKETPHQ